VGGFTLPLSPKLARHHAAGGPIRVADQQYGWQMTMAVWAVLCLVLFLVTFSTTKERNPAGLEGKKPRPNRILPISSKTTRGKSCFS